MLRVYKVYLLLMLPSVIHSTVNYDDLVDYQPFNILGLKDDACEDKTRNLKGNCQPWDICVKLNGIQGEPCAFGLGVCCFWQTSCGAYTSAKLSQFVNPSYPGSDSGKEVSGSARDCRFTIRVFKKSICQLRLNLDVFELSQPEEDGSSMVRCIKQRFQVRSAHGNHLGFTELCGNNSGQHLYIPVDSSLGPTTVQMVITTESGASAFRWKIRSTQIDCSKDEPLVAPTGCLQYYTGDRGTFSSLGFGGNENRSGVPASAAMPAGLDYSVCIKRCPNARGVRYTSPGMSFKLPEYNSSRPENCGQSNCTEAEIASAPSTTGVRPTAVQASGALLSSEAKGCRSATDLTSFLYIPGGVCDRGACGGQQGKFFGESLATAAVISYMRGPVSVWVKSPCGGINGTGFQLEFEQITASC